MLKGSFLILLFFENSDAGHESLEVNSAYVCVHQGAEQTIVHSRFVSGEISLSSYRRKYDSIAPGSNALTKVNSF